MDTDCCVEMHSAYFTCGLYYEAGLLANRGNFASNFGD